MYYYFIVVNSSFLQDIRTKGMHAWITVSQQLSNTAVWPPVHVFVPKAFLLTSVSPSSSCTHATSSNSCLRRGNSSGCCQISTASPPARAKRSLFVVSWKKLLDRDVREVRVERSGWYHRGLPPNWNWGVVNMVSILKRNNYSINRWTRNYPATVLIPYVKLCSSKLWWVFFSILKYHILHSKQWENNWFIIYKNYCSRNLKLLWQQYIPKYFICDNIQKEETLCCKRMSTSRQFLFVCSY